MLISLFSVGYGAVNSLTGPVIIKLLGAERIGVYLGLNIFSYGVGCLLSAPFSGRSVMQEVAWCSEGRSGERGAGRGNEGE